jgi:hypothetical protein
MVLLQLKQVYILQIRKLSLCIMKEEPSAALSRLQLLHGVTLIIIQKSCFAVTQLKSNFDAPS